MPRTVSIRAAVKRHHPRSRSFAHQGPASVRLPQAETGFPAGEHGEPWPEDELETARRIWPVPDLFPPRSVCPGGDWRLDVRPRDGDLVRRSPTGGEPGCRVSTLPLRAVRGSSPPSKRNEPVAPRIGGGGQVGGPRYPRHLRLDDQDATPRLAKDQALPPLRSAAAG